MRITINFHAPENWHFRRGGMLCLCIGLVAAATVLMFGWAVHSDINRWSVGLQSLKKQKAIHVSTEDTSPTEEIKTELQAANQIIERLNTPWSDLFASLERVYNDNAILLGIEPDPISRSISITAESKDKGSMLQFVRQIRATKIFGDAHVVNHVINQNDPQRPVRFSVTAHWLDALPESATPQRTLTEDKKDLEDSPKSSQKLVTSEGAV